jgi:hypothetical protein
MIFTGMIKSINLEEKKREEIKEIMDEYQHKYNIARDKCLLRKNEDKCSLMYEDKWARDMIGNFKFVGYINKTCKAYYQGCPLFTFMVIMDTPINLIE